METRSNAEALYAARVTASNLRYLAGTWRGAGSAVDCALDIRARAVTEPQFLGTRQGIHCGPVLYREGAYYGATVNLSARIVAEAAADQILVSGELRDAIGELGDVVFMTEGHRRVKHVVEPIEVYDARRVGDDEVGCARSIRCAA